MVVHGGSANSRGANSGGTNSYDANTAGTSTEGMNSRGTNNEYANGEGVRFNTIENTIPNDKEPHNLKHLENAQLMGL